MPKREMLINYVPGEECRIAITEDGRLEEFYQERASSGSHVGNIYKGRVVNVEPSIQAAFIDFGLDRNGFLHISDLHPKFFPGQAKEDTERVGKKTPRRDRPPIQHCLKRGQEIPVQVIKEGIGTKGPTLTSYLSIPGRYLVMMLDMERLGVSRKIEDDQERGRIREMLDELSPPEGFGFIVRTAGIGRTKTELKRDLAYLQRLWKNIQRGLASRRRVGELYTESDLIIRTIRDVFSTDIDRIIVDDQDAAMRAHEFLAVASPRAGSTVYLYDDPVPLFHRFDIERQIETIHARTVPLPSGGSLVIDSTEALVAIDVNSGKMRDQSNPEATAYKTNIEAVDEICRQLRLRDLGGVVVNDLIDMMDPKHRREIERRMRERLKVDRARTHVLPISQFGIVEMTRQRMRPSLARAMTIECHHCHGAGQVRSAESVVLAVMRQLAVALHDKHVARVDLTVSPDVAFQLLNRKRQFLVEMEQRFGKAVLVRVNDGGSIDFLQITAYDARGGTVEPSFRHKAADAKLIVTSDLTPESDARDVEEETSLDEADEQAEQAEQATEEASVEEAPGGQEKGRAARGRGRRGGRRGRGGQNGDSRDAEESGAGESATAEKVPSTAPAEPVSPEVEARRAEVAAKAAAALARAEASLARAAQAEAEQAAAAGQDEAAEPADDDGASAAAEEVAPEAPVSRWRGRPDIHGDKVIAAAPPAAAPTVEEAEPEVNGNVASPADDSEATEPTGESRRGDAGEDVGGEGGKRRRRRRRRGRGRGGRGDRDEASHDADQERPLPGSREAETEPDDSTTIGGHTFFNPPIPEGPSSWDEDPADVAVASEQAADTAEVDAPGTERSDTERAAESSPDDAAEGEGSRRRRRRRRGGRNRRRRERAETGDSNGQASEGDANIAAAGDAATEVANEVSAADAVAAEQDDAADWLADVRAEAIEAAVESDAGLAEGVAEASPETVEAEPSVDDADSPMELDEAPRADAMPESESGPQSAPEPQPEAEPAAPDTAQAPTAAEAATVVEEVASRPEDEDPAERSFAATAQAEGAADEGAAGVEEIPDPAPARKPAAKKTTRSRTTKTTGTAKRTRAPRKTGAKSTTSRTRSRKSAAEKAEAAEGKAAEAGDAALEENSREGNQEA